MELKEAGRLIEDRVYHTCMGIWRYFTVMDDQLDPEHNNYLMIGTLESFIRTREFFGDDKMIPVMLELDDGVRLQRALDREKYRNIQGITRCAVVSWRMKKTLAKKN